jgi:hypothetical protein
MFQAGNDAEPAQTGQPHLTEDVFRSHFAFQFATPEAWQL